MKLYKEEILDHYKNPRNFGLVDGPSFISDKHNPSCGDSVIMSGVLRDGVIVKIGFQGTGCALSIAMASKLTEFVLGRPVDDLCFSDDLIFQLLGIELGPNRMMCGQLPLIALKSALSKANS